jgi:hypothetical protein
MESSVPRGNQCRERTTWGELNLDIPRASKRS